MHQKEVKRPQILDLSKAGSISQQEASKRIGISARQVRRLAKRYQLEGLDGLISKKRGIASSRWPDEMLRTSAIAPIGTLQGFRANIRQRKARRASSNQALRREYVAADDHGWLLATQKRL